jgi:alpha-amylase
MTLVSREVGENGAAEARAELYRGQSNDPLWHGVFGGLYLPHLREASYGHLLRAEKLALATPDPRWRIEDYDADGSGEAILRGGAYAAIVKPRRGGGLVEIDHYPLSRNLGDVLGRRREAYHVEKGSGHSSEGGSIHELAKVLPGEARSMFRYDADERLSGLDRIYDPGPEIETLDAVAAEDRAGFIRVPYEFQVREKSLCLRAKGPAALSSAPTMLEVEKTFTLGEEGIETALVIRNPGPAAASFRFGSEWNIYQLPEEFRLEAGGASLCGGRLRWEAESADVRAFPIETLSQSERGYDIIHQGSICRPQRASRRRSGWGSDPATARGIRR